MANYSELIIDWGEPLVSWSYHETFLRTWSVDRSWLTGSLYLCRDVIGRECRQFVPCVVLCGIDLDRLDDFCILFIALFTFFVTFDDFRVSIELACGRLIFALVRADNDLISCVARLDHQTGSWPRYSHRAIVCSSCMWMLSMITFNMILHVSCIMNEGSEGIGEQENNLCHTTKKTFELCRMSRQFVSCNFPPSYVRFIV